MIRVIYVGLKYDYGIPARGYSYEYENFYSTLKRMPNVDATLFPFDEVLRSVGRESMNARLRDLVRENQPQVCYFVLFTDEIAKETIRWISDKSGAVTLNWFGDDHWRFESFSKRWAPLFHWVVTTDSISASKYVDLGCKKVIESQWAFNHFEEQPVDVGPDLDVTFVGQVHSDRLEIIQYLRRAGIPVDCWGKGWENGRMTRNEMLKLFLRSRVNLNFTEGLPTFGWKPLAKIALNRRADDSLRLNSLPEMVSYASVLFRKKRKQIKGRNFEIPGVGGFLLTGNAEGLERYYVPGKEIGVFENPDGLIDKIRYYLEHDSEREAVRRAGHERTLRDHTYEKRFMEIFRAIGIEG